MEWNIIAGRRAERQGGCLSLGAVRFLSLGAVSTDPRESRHISMAPPESAGRLSIHCTVNTADASPDDETSDGRAGPAHDMDIVRSPVRLKHSIVSYDADNRTMTE